MQSVFYIHPLYQLVSDIGPYTKPRYRNGFLASLTTMNLGFNLSDACSVCMSILDFFFLTISLIGGQQQQLKDHYR